MVSDVHVPTAEAGYSMVAEAVEAPAALGACSCFPSGMEQYSESPGYRRPKQVWLHLEARPVRYSVQPGPAPWILHALAWWSHDMDVNVPPLILANSSILSMAWLRSLFDLIWVSGMVKSSPGTAA